LGVAAAGNAAAIAGAYAKESSYGSQFRLQTRDLCRIAPSDITETDIFHQMFVLPSARY
jgi:hypothetical protein